MWFKTRQWSFAFSGGNLFSIDGVYKSFYWWFNSLKAKIFDVTWSKRKHTYRKLRCVRPLTTIFKALSDSKLSLISLQMEINQTIWMPGNHGSYSEHCQATERFHLQVSLNGVSKEEVTL